MTSILKRRSSDQALLSHSTSLYSLPDDSEDTASHSERSEVSDEPVVGRRAIREKGGFYESDEEESDDDYTVKQKFTTKFHLFCVLFSRAAVK